MQSKIKTRLSIAALGIAFVAAWAVALSIKPPRNIHAVNTPGTGILDGMEFTGKVGLIGKPIDIEDTWSFANGTFVSTECETQCRYPRVPYYVRQQSEAVEFIGETYCLDKDAKISWHGVVSNGKIKGTFTWHIARWYWTVEKKFWFEGNLTRQTDASITN